MPVGERNYSSWRAWMGRLAEVERPPRCPEGDAVAANAWRRGAARTLDELLAPWPTPVAPALEVLDESSADGVTRREVVFDTEVDMSVPATLLLPAGPPPEGAAGAVLAVHGHGPGRAEAVAWGTEWARAGFVVLAPDLRGFGERAEPTFDDEKYWCDLNAVSGQLFGIHPLTQNLWDLQRALRVLGDLPEVDDESVGVAGFSYGATCALFLAAIDLSVRAVVVSGYLSSFTESHKMPANLCGSQVLPGLLGRLEHGDLGALISPRPLFVESCREDYLFPWQTAAEEVEHLRRLGGVVEHHVHDGDHHWVGEGVVDFLSRSLRGS